MIQPLKQYYILIQNGVKITSYFHLLKILDFNFFFLAQNIYKLEQNFRATFIKYAPVCRYYMTIKQLLISFTTTYAQCTHLLLLYILN